MGEAMAVTNTIGNGVAAIVVGHWSGRLDREQLSRQLSTRRDEARRILDQPLF
jgi:aerobic C4-dicarboxylate transport protein